MPRGAHRRRRLVAGILLVGVALGLSTAVAFAATGTLTASPSTGLTNGQSVTLSGSGFTPSSPANILECNNAPNEPTVHLGAPVNSDVSVGCSAPSLGASLTSTSATGTVSKSYSVVSGTVGPPCGHSGDLAATCPATDSAGKDPKTDAAAYPCPPTAAQQAAGVTCSLSFGDQAGDVGKATITFSGESAPTTAAAPTTTAVPSTTAAPTTTAATAQDPATPSVLANTGPGPGIGVLALVGVGLLGLAGALLLVLAGLDPPRRGALRRRDHHL